MAAGRLGLLLLLLLLALVAVATGVDAAERGPHHLVNLLLTRRSGTEIVSNVAAGSGSAAGHFRWGRHSPLSLTRPLLSFRRVPVPFPYPVFRPDQITIYSPMEQMINQGTVPVPVKVPKYYPVPVHKVIEVPRYVEVPVETPVYQEVIVRRPIEVPVPVYIFSRGTEATTASRSSSALPAAASTSLIKAVAAAKTGATDAAQAGHLSDPLGSASSELTSSRLLLDSYQAPLVGAPGDAFHHQQQHRIAVGSTALSPASPAESVTSAIATPAPLLLLPRLASTPGGGVSLTDDDDDGLLRLHEAYRQYMAAAAAAAHNNDGHHENTVSLRQRTGSAAAGVLAHAPIALVKKPKVLTLPVSAGYSGSSVSHSLYSSSNSLNNNDNNSNAKQFGSVLPFAAVGEGRKQTRVSLTPDLHPGTLAISPR